MRCPVRHELTGVRAEGVLTAALFNILLQVRKLSEATASLNSANDRVAKLEKELEAVNIEHARRISDVKAELLESSQDADRVRTQQTMLQGQWRDLQQKYALEKQDLKAKLLKFEDELAQYAMVEGQLRQVQQEHALEKQDKEELKAKLLNFEDERADAVFVRQDVFFV
jgi:hypothetical protein